MNRKYLENRVSFQTSTFYLNPELSRVLAKMLTQYGSIRNLLHTALKRKARLFIPGQNEFIALRTQYQPPHPEMKRVDFRPFDEDWEKLRLIAFSKRISMSLLFALILVHWDEYFGGNGDDDSVQTKFNKIRIMFSLHGFHTFSLLEMERLLE